MAVTNCAAGAWTAVVTTTADTIIEARGRSVYIDASGTPPADPSEGYALASGQSMVVSSGNSVSAYPANPVHPAKVYSNPI